MTKLLAYHGKQEVKDEYVMRVKAHYDADEITKGVYWQNGKGCAVGCTLHSSDHAAYETELGIPRALARIEDGIFEGLPNNKAKEFPLQFLNAIKVGADLSMVAPKFIHWLLVDETHGIIKFAKHKEVIKAIADLYQRKINGENIDTNEWFTARKNAYAASAAYAAYAAAAAASAAAAAYASDAAAASASDAAAAAYAAYAAAAAADAAAYATADAGTREKVRTVQADKLLELLSEAE